MSASVAAPPDARFQALAVTFVPEMEALDAAGWRQVDRVVQGMLARRSPAMRRQLRLFLRLLDLLSLLRHGRRFAGLPLAARVRFLTGLQDGPLLLLRRGVWGVRTLVFMGYYTRPETRAEIGYRADPRGWEARR
jgi:hypothetical protein